MKSNVYLTPLIYINLKQIKDLNVSPDTIELPEESIEKTIPDPSVQYCLVFFLIRCQKHKQQKQNSTNKTTLN